MLSKPVHMNRIVRYTTLLALAAATPSLFAEISVPAVPAAAARSGNCDLLASNTVRATYVGQHDLAVQTINDDAPTTAKVAVFEVIDLLGYKKYNRFGDGRLTAGTKFTISMSRELPGQPASIADTIEQMQPGEEAVLRVDHLYLMNGQQGEPLRVCSRMARRAAQPAVTTEQPATPAAPADGSAPAEAPSVSNNVPLPTVGAPAPNTASGSTFSATSTSVSITRDANGNMTQTRTESVYDPATGQMKTRMFINGAEVDPQTKQPLLQSVTPAPAAQTAPAAQSSAPAEPAPTPAKDNGSDDTIVEHGDAPAATAPEAPAATDTPAPAPAAPAPAPAEEEGF